MQLPGRNQSDGTAGSPGNPTGRIRIEAENFSGQQGVETENCGDLGGTLDVGYIDAGNFISYNVAAPVSGVYTLNFRLANGGSTSSFQVKDSLSGAVLGTVSVPPTGGWQNYVTLSATATLPAGQQTLQLLCTSNNWNLNWLELLPPGTGSGGYNGNGAYHIEAEDFISQNGTLLENCQDAGGTYNVGSIDNGDWLDYRVNMPVGGTYQLRVRAATGNGGTVQLRTAAGAVLATLPISNTNGYQTFQTFTATVTLPAGVQTLRLAVTGGYLSVNWLELAAPPGAPPLDNYALVVNSNNNYIGGLYYDVENTFTVEFLVKPSGTHEIDVESTSGFGGTSGQKYVLFPVMGGESYDSRSGMGVSVGTNGVSVYEHAAAYMPALLVWQSPTPLTEWTHVAVVYNNGKPSLYINGVWKKDGLPSPKSHVHPGTALPGGYYGNQANGQVDEVRIWSVARTQQQLVANKDGELTGTQTGLVGYWPMNEGTGAVLHDVSGWGRDIDLTHAGYGSASWTNGRYSINTNTGSYRYGFNGKEKDEDIGEDDYDYGMRIHDARLGRFLSVDPLTGEYPWNSTYAYAENDVIRSIDVEGAEKHVQTFAYSVSNGKTVATVISNDYKQPEGTSNVYAMLGGTPTTTEETVAQGFVSANKLPAGGTFSFFVFDPALKKDNYAKYEYSDPGGKQHVQYFDAGYVDGMYDFYEKEQQQAQKILNIAGATANLVSAGILAKAELKAIAGEINARKRASTGVGSTNEKCFVAGTKILTALGLKNIEKIVIGDSVWSYNDTTGKVELNRVEALFKNITKRLIKLTLANTTIWTTPEHRFWINRGWLTANNINIGDSVQLFSGVRQVVNEKSLIDTITAVYNFTVSRFHSYYISELNILVHNDCYFQWQKNKSMADVLTKGIHGNVSDLKGAVGEVRFELVGEEIKPIAFGKDLTNKQVQYIEKIGTQQLAKPEFKSELLGKVDEALNSGQIGTNTNRYQKLLEMKKILTPSPGSPTTTP